MAKKKWNFEVDGTNHSVELEQGSLFGGKVIRVDGTVLDKKLFPRKFGQQFTGSEDRIEVDGHEVIIYTFSNGFSFKHDLTVDGISVQTGQPVASPLPLPGWAWLPIIIEWPLTGSGLRMPSAINSLRWLLKTRWVKNEAVQDDSSGYPDCREEFFTAFNEVIKGKKEDLKITKLLSKKK